MPSVIRLESDLPGGPREAFELSLSVEDHLRSMAHSRERAIDATGPVLGLGDEVTWAARHFGVTWKMRVRITELDRPRRFVDEQIRGPFSWFRHEHLFEASKAGTRMTDIVSFRAPLGPLGRLAERPVLERRLRKLIWARAEYLETALAGRGRSS